MIIGTLGAYAVHLMLLLIMTPFLYFEPWDARFLLVWGIQGLAYGVFAVAIYHAAKVEIYGKSD